MDCYFCEASGSKVRISEVISSKGIVGACDLCIFKENLPVLRRPTTFQLKEAERPNRVYDALSSARKSRFKEGFQPKMNPEDVTLKDLVDKNYEKSVKKDLGPRPDLVENFHWVIMRARSLKKLSHQQLAREISESEVAVKLAEKGILPEDDYRLVNKIEGFLGIKIVKNKIEGSMVYEKQPARIIDFNPVEVQNLTIADLQKIKKERESLENVRSLNESESFEGDFDEDLFDEDSK